MASTFAKSVIDICHFAHKNNSPKWADSTDAALFEGLERDQQWQLGILLGVISPGKEAPHCKALPPELQGDILSALMQV